MSYMLTLGFIMVWVMKAKFILADKTFLRLDKRIRKYGMWALLEIYFYSLVTSLVIHGVFVLITYLRNWL